MKKKNIVTIADGNVRGVPLGIADYDQMTDSYYANESLGFTVRLIFCLLDFICRKSADTETN